MADTKDAKDGAEAKAAPAPKADELKTDSPRRSRRPAEPAHEDTHQHAGYTSDEDLQTRLDAASGQDAPAGPE